MPSGGPSEGDESDEFEKNSRHDDDDDNERLMNENELYI